ncbi:Potassium voltage-gated channel subfamily B member 2 [Mycena venus]|uniref:Potassium voltage-gated channel subfamily B member 2 n=1 Tax=Mycena venus TaxID=2733690 RepID=A0A8H7CJA7_9AGAR|nr:Potassium voltage-gated channel subfamily B member 2 [Mycena venus]
MSAPIELTRVGQVSARFLTEDPPRPHSPQDIPEIFHFSPSRDEATLAAIEPEWRRNLFALLEQPASSDSAFLVHIAVTTLVVLSAVVTVLETVPAFHSIRTSVWFGLETSLVALFTIEYIARCLAWSNTWRSLLGWILSFFGIIDLLSVLPYYIELVLLQDTSVFFRFSILRMFRLLRVFRPFRSNNTVLLTIEVMYISVRQSQHALFALGFFVIMVLTVFSTLLYFAERGTWDDILETFINTDGDPSQFASIPAAAWFVLVTITTVGYGEITPRSFLGRLVTLPLLVFGLLLIALPSFVLGREFSLVWERMTHDVRLPSVFVIHSKLIQLCSPRNPSHSPQSPPFLNRRRRDSIFASQSQSTPSDLSNRKLAHNQTELSKQIAELRGVVEAQGQLIARLVTAMEGKGKARAHDIG